MTDLALPVPVIDDPDSGGFWQATARGELAVRVCEDCAHVLHLPKAFCHVCGSWRSEWNPVQPFGRLYSWTTVRRRIHPAFAVPYTIVLVELVDLPAARLIGHLDGAPELSAGMTLVARFEVRGEATVPVWEVGDQR